MGIIPRNALTDQSQPARNLRAVTPHASNNLPDGPCRALWVGTGGDISIIAGNDTEAVALVSVPDGALLPISVKAVRASGTTADDIVALY